jgi:hypothetical protein
MTTVLIVHEVDDVDHWLTSPKREEVFGPLGFTARTFIDPTNAHRVGLIVEGTAGLDAVQQFLTTDEAAAAMKHDGVRPETVVMLVEP